VSAGSAARDRLKCGKRSYGEMDWVRPGAATALLALAFVAITMRAL